MEQAVLPRPSVPITVDILQHALSVVHVFSKPTIVHVTIADDEYTLPVFLAVQELALHSSIATLAPTARAESPRPYTTSYRLPMMGTPFILKSARVSTPKPLYRSSLN